MKENVKVALCEIWEKGGEGGKELIDILVDEIGQEKGKYKPLYELTLSIKEKVNKIAKEIYGAKAVEFSPKALKTIVKLEKMGYSDLPICISKTQKSLSDNPSLLGRPEDFIIKINEIRISSGAGFIVAMAGEIIDMPGLPKKPAAESIDIDKNGKITGLF